MPLARGKRAYSARFAIPNGLAVVSVETPGCRPYSAVQVQLSFKRCVGELAGHVLAAALALRSSSLLPILPEVSMPSLRPFNAAALPMRRMLALAVSIYTMVLASVPMLSTVRAQTPWEPQPASAAVPTASDAPHQHGKSTLFRPAVPVSPQSTYRPNPGVQAKIDAMDATLATQGASFAAGDVSIQGEIVVMEGDASFVTDFGGGQYGLRFDNQQQDPIALTNKFYENFGDDFDFLVVWTSFQDQGSEGLAYYIGVKNDTQGIGRELYNQSPFWGSSSSKLQGFLNMKAISSYGSNITNPNNPVYAIMGQEITHRWLAFMQFQRANGQMSGDMLGRDDSHWSALMHAHASVQDGIWWNDNGNGTFTKQGDNASFSPLDLYGMGLYAPEEVEPWFLIDDAMYNGQSVGPVQANIPNGLTVSGTKTEITIEQVIAANGARLPNATNSQKEFRIAYILVTAPGEGIASVQEELADIETFRNIWDEQFSEWTDGRATICSRASGPCDKGVLAVESVSIDDATAGDGDGLAEPGETVLVRPRLINSGTAGIDAGEAAMVIDGVPGVTLNNSLTLFPALEAGGTVETNEPFGVKIGADVECGTELELKLTFTAGKVQASDTIRLPVGLVDIFYDGFEEEQGWVVNADGIDTAANGRWERKSPEGVTAGYLGLDITTQPGADKSGSGLAMVTGAGGGDLGEFDVDDGVTSVTSPEIALGDAYDPRLSFWMWRTGLNFNDPSGEVVPEDNDPLIVQVSADGSTWIQVLADITNAQEWAYREYRLSDVFGGTLPDSIHVRFTAVDAAPQSLSEALVDEVRVFDLAPSCFGITEPEPTPDSAPDNGGATDNSGEPDAKTGGDDNNNTADAGGADAESDGNVTFAGGSNGTTTGCELTTRTGTGSGNALPWIVALAMGLWMTRRGRNASERG